MTTFDQRSGWVIRTPTGYVSMPGLYAHRSAEFSHARIYNRRKDALNACRARELVIRVVITEAE